MILGWFSGGATSAVAIKKVIDAGHKVCVMYMETGAHHPDHTRFLEQCEKWYGQHIYTLQNAKYKSPLDVIKKERFINGPSGAKCTQKLKKEVRTTLEKIMPFEAQIFGFEFEKKQINRAIRFQEQYPEAKAVFPLIELGWDKERCLRELMNAGIELPAMYKLGYSNSNCIGCVKGGAGYWNKIRNDFPQMFNDMASHERLLNKTCLKTTVNGKTKRIFLDELEPDAGRHEDISLPECGVTCPVELDGLQVKTDLSFLQNKIFQGGHNEETFIDPLHLPVN